MDETGNPKLDRRNLGKTVASTANKSLNKCRKTGLEG